MSHVFLLPFFHCRSVLPWWPLAFLTFSPPLQNFHVVHPTKKCLLFPFFSSSSSLSLFFSLSFAGLSPTLFLCLSLSLYSIYVDMTINLSLTLKTTRIQKQFPLSVFVFASQDAGGYVFSRQNNLELHLASNTCWLSYFTFVCLWCRRTTDGRTVTWLSKFLRWVDYHIFLWGYTRAHEELRYKIIKEFQIPLFKVISSRIFTDFWLLKNL